MPESVTTAMIVGALALGAAEKASGKVAEKAAESLWEKSKALLGGDEIITLFPRAADSAGIQKELETKLEEKLAADPTARQDLEEIFRRLPQQVQNNVMNITGDGNIGIQGVQGSTININKP